MSAVWVRQKRRSAAGPRQTAVLMLLPCLAFAF
jgi:hypothetical protein